MLTGSRSRQTPGGSSEADADRRLFTSNSPDSPLTVSRPDGDRPSHGQQRLAPESGVERLVAVGERDVHPPFRNGRRTAIVTLRGSWDGGTLAGRGRDRDRDRGLGWVVATRAPRRPVADITTVTTITRGHPRGLDHGGHHHHQRHHVECPPPATGLGAQNGEVVRPAAPDSPRDQFSRSLAGRRRRTGRWFRGVAPASRRRR